MFLIVIRILLAGIVGCAVTFYLQTPKVYFNASRSGDTLVFKYSHDYTSNAIKQLRIEYEDEGGQQIVPIIKNYEYIRITQEAGKFVIEDFHSNVKSINVIYDLQYDSPAPSMFHKEKTIFID
ncbi:hypothetical protein [Leptospira interrogans]|uniref:hypothetical protein n=1 Tax=Leptospira interrogans TaxID=173 RepID=UPI0018DEE724|nr:hypothetical protein [Leptospira interrogans]